MSFINVSLNVVSYADQIGTSNPNLKYVDLRWSLLGLPSAFERTVPVNLSPGETSTIMTTARTLTYSNMTSMVISSVSGTSNARITAALGQRTEKDYGNGTTQWAITISNTLVKLTYTGTGTAPDFSSIAPGDNVTLGAPYGILNQGDFVVVKVGVDYIQYVNSLGSTETQLGGIDIYSSGPVRVGDALYITSTAFSFPNRGEFVISRVTGTFIEFSNPNVVPETITGVQTTDLSIYPEAHQWMLLAVDNPVTIRLNNDTGNGVVVEPVASGDIVNTPGLLLKRGKVFRIDAINNGIVGVTGTLFLSG